MKYEFNKNLIMTEKEEYLFEQSNSCWICKKIIDNEVNLGVVLIGIVILTFI